MSAAATIQSVQSQRQEALAAIFRCCKFNSFISKVEPEHFRDDLKSEVMLILAEKPGETIIDLYNNNKLSYYAIKVAANSLFRKRSSFTRLYERTTVNIEPIIVTNVIPEGEWHEVNGRVVQEIKQEPVLVLLSRLKQLVYQKNPNYISELFPKISWYRQYMISLYMKLGSYREMENETNIPWESCYSTVKETILLLRSHFKININDSFHH